MNEYTLSYAEAIRLMRDRNVTLETDRSGTIDRYQRFNKDRYDHWFRSAHKRGKWTYCLSTDMCDVQVTQKFRIVEEGEFETSIYLKRWEFDIIKQALTEVHTLHESKAVLEVLNEIEKQAKYNWH